MTDHPRDGIDPEPAELPRLSVVMPARNSEPFLAEALDALADQEYPQWWETIIVSGGSTDRTVPIARSYRDRLPHLQVVALDTPAIPSRAQNIGIGRSSGDVLVFLDSDDVTAPGYLAALGQALLEHPVVGARVAANQINAADTQNWRRPLQTDHIETFFNFWPGVIGAAMAARRDPVIAVDGFDEALATQQDIDLSWRLLAAGYPATHVPDAVLHYRYRADNRQIFRQHVGYGIGEAQLFKKYRAAGMPRRGPIRFAASLARLGGALLNPDRVAGRSRAAAISGLLAGRLRGSIQHKTLYL